MSWIQPVLALIGALMFGAVLVYALGWRHPRRSRATPSLLFLIVLMFPLLWAAAIWLVPVGPTLYGAAFVPMLLAGVLVALIIAVLIEPRPPQDQEAVEADTAFAVFGILFWVLLLISAGAVVAGYVS